MLPPSIARLARRLFGAADSIEALASRSICLDPQHLRTAPPAIFERRDLERVTGLAQSTTMKRELQRIEGGRDTHGASMAWELTDAVISGSHIYKRRLKYRIDARDEDWFGLGSTRKVSEGVLSCTYYGGLYFGHAIRDDMPLNLLAETIGIPVRSSAPLHAHQEAYLRMARLHADPHDRAQFDRLLVIDDAHQSQSRIRRTRELRSRLHAHLPRPEHVGVYINRKGSGSARRLAKENEVVALFAARGFAIVDPQQMSALDILTHASGARIVAGVEGSHFGHGVLSCADDCTFFVLQPPTRFGNVYKDFTDAMDMRYAFIVGERVTSEVFSVDLGELSRMLDRLQAVSPAALFA
jgi:hypothetical protein